MPPLIQTVIAVLVVWSGICFRLGHSDENNNRQSWSLRLSDSTRAGRFLNVPIYYGDWVPLTKAKQTIEAVAAKIQNNLRRQDPPLEIITADEPEDRLDNKPVYYQQTVPYEKYPSHQQQQQQQHHHQSQQQHHYKHPQQQTHPWRNHKRPQQLRRQDYTRRNHRKLPPPAPFANQISSLFQHQQHHGVPTTPKPEDVTTSGFSLGSVFSFLNPLTQHKPDTLLYNSPAIKTLPAPDLTKVSFKTANWLIIIMLDL
jgi:hypothetical protein